ncbi:MAG: UDP-glucose/GDP-mannose dehydrogenase family protein [Spirochaetaceae bacterium]|nr:UDP-glucose/GDP-mannose dehydrogenase family protein [Spirochaetaceae bacterium]
MKITIIGAGYVGLVGAVCFAEQGHNVLAVEINEPKLNKLKKGLSPIYEKDLEPLLQKALASGKLSFTASIKEAANFAEIIMLCVGTPQSDDGQADLRYIQQAVEEIARYSTGYKLIVEKSTVPVGTHKQIIDWIKNINQNLQTDVASNPEFLREGLAVKDFMQPDRIVCGVASDKAKALLNELYQPFIKQNVAIIFTNVASAELIKQAANSFLATKISYANMLAELCEKVDANINDVTHGIGLDARIGSKFLQAGIGYGGSCFPKDIAAFIRTGEEHGLNLGLLRETAYINARQRERFINKIKININPLFNKKIALWGLAFKPDTDDVRAAPAIYLVKELLGNQAQVRLYDPKAMTKFKEHFNESANLTYFDDMYEAVKNADGLVLVTEWPQFSEADFAKMKELMTGRHIFDARNALNSAVLKELGFNYVGMGR